MTIPWVIWGLKVAAVLASKWWIVAGCSYISYQLPKSPKVEESVVLIKKGEL